MVDRIGIWSMTKSESGRDVATPLEEVHSTETEERLEQLLVETPDLLIKGLRLIGRQVHTAGGPLDLLGVDPNGQVVLFELKRGTLTREAVAQVLDYASELLERDPADFADLIQTSSGRYGIDKIDDFSDWFSAEFPEVAEPDLSSLRLVLVGLGVDDRAKRIVNLLARSGLDIQLLTFQAFRRGSETLLARQVETIEPIARPRGAGGGTKRGNRQLLDELAREQGVHDLLMEVAEFIDVHIKAYRWPNKTAFSYSLNDVTEDGRPTQRNWASLWVDTQVRGRVLFSLPDRAIEAADAAVERLVSTIPEARVTSNSWTPFELPITSESWPTLRPNVEELLKAVVAGWEARLAAQGASTSS